MGFCVYNVHGGLSANSNLRNEKLAIGSHVSGQAIFFSPTLFACQFLIEIINWRQCLVNGRCRVDFGTVSRLFRSNSEPNTSDLCVRYMCNRIRMMIMMWQVNGKWPATSTYSIQKDLAVFGVSLFCLTPGGSFLLWCILRTNHSLGFFPFQNSFHFCVSHFVHIVIFNLNLNVNWWCHCCCITEINSHSFCGFARGSK